MLDNKWKQFKSKYMTLYIKGLIYLIVGLILIISPEIVSDWGIRLFGLLFIVDAAQYILSYINENK